MRDNSGDATGNSSSTVRRRRAGDCAQRRDTARTSLYSSSTRSEASDATRPLAAMNARIQRSLSVQVQPAMSATSAGGLSRRRSSNEAERARAIEPSASHSGFAVAAKRPVASRTCACRLALQRVWACSIVAASHDRAEPGTWASLAVESDDTNARAHSTPTQRRAASRSRWV